MAQLPSSFNSNEHEEMGDFSALPKGDYTVKITESDYVQNSKKTGHILKITRTVVGGKFDGRKIFSNLNLDNPNPVAVEIANKEFTSTCKACNLVVVEDSEELHNIEHTINLGVNKDGENTIKAILPLSRQAAPESPSSPAAGKKKRKKPVFED